MPNDKILDWSKFKAIADDKIKVTEKLKIFLACVENIVGKGENACYQHFLVFPQCFPKASSAGSFKVVIVWYRVNPLSDMPILGFSTSAVKKNMMLKIWTNGDTIILPSRKHCGKRRNCLLQAISSFPTMFQMQFDVDASK